jgi:hypothetical protein
VVLLNLDEPSFSKQLRDRTADIVHGKPRTPCDIVFMGAKGLADLKRLSKVKTWIEPNGAIWVIRPKGPTSPIRDTDLIDAGLAAGLVDNKIASFSDTQGAMRFVFRLRDRPQLR